MGDAASSPPFGAPPASPEDRLESWKEIAAYLERDIRTVQRWERVEGLPVYRRPARRLGGVFAYRSELDAWRAGRTLEPRGATESLRPSRRTIIVIAGTVAAGALVFLVLGDPKQLRRAAIAVGLENPCTPPSGLSGWWRANGDASDAVGGRHAVLEDGATFTPGRVGQAFLLDGKAARVRVPSPALASVADQELTVAAWVRFRSVVNLATRRRAPFDDMSLVDRMATSPDRLTFLAVNVNGWRLLKQSDHRFWFCFGGRDKNRCGLPSHTVFSTTLAVNDIWYHVAVVKDSKAFAMYVNGVREDSRALPPSNLMLDTSAGDLLLGFNASEGAFLNGTLDEVMLFDRALSSRQIARLTEPPALEACR